MAKRVRHTKAPRVALQGRKLVSIGLVTSVTYERGSKAYIHTFRKPVYLYRIPRTQVVVIHPVNGTDELKD